MILIYGEGGLSSERALRMYRERFAMGRQPGRRMFVNIVQQLRDTGSLVSHIEGRGQQRSLEVLLAEEEVLDAVDENPGVSTRSLSRQVGISHTSVHRILREQLLYPYHYQRVQHLIEQDLPRRQLFSEWFLARSENHPDFVSKILATDEACFTRNGVVNFHNLHSWCDENPHNVRRNNFQHRFAINVWCGIVGDHVVGPVVLPPRLTGHIYLQFLQNTLPGLLEDIPLETRNAMWYLHDGAPAHVTRQVRDFLNLSYPGRWIGLNGPVRWPARSPDLNPLDFYYWGHMKEIVYATEVHTVEDLRERIFAASATINNDEGVCRRMRRNWLRRHRACVRANGGHFEHHL